jgi:hypothetical protein
LRGLLAGELCAMYTDLSAMFSQSMASCSFF